MNDDILAIETAWGYEWISDDLSLKVEHADAFSE